MATNAFQDALAAGDKPTLIQLIKDHPTWDTIIQLSDALHKLSVAQPSQIDIYTATLVSLGTSLDVPQITFQTNGRTSQDAFRSVFREQIHNLITALLSDKKITEIAPTTTYLAISLLSGSAIHCGLCVSSQQIGEITLGLQFKESDYKEYASSKTYELNAVGACIQVLAAGQAILATDQLHESELKEQIMSINKVAKCDSSKRIIQATQDLVASNFKKPLSSQEIVSLFQESQP